MVATLQLTQHDFVHPNRKIFQTEDGTIIARDYHPKKLFVRWQNDRFSIELPSARQLTFTQQVLGDSMYFFSESQVYKASFVPPDSFTITFVRSIAPTESIDLAGNCVRTQGVNDYVYRVQDSPFDAVLVDVPEELRPLLMSLGVHRRKIVYFNRAQSHLGPPTMNAFTENSFVVNLPFDGSDVQMYTRDATRFIYFLCCNHLCALDTESGQFLPPLVFSHPCTYFVFHEGVISMIGRDISRSYLMTAQLPEGYFDRVAPMVNPPIQQVEEQDYQRMIADQNVLVDAVEELRETNRQLVLRLEAKERQNEQLQDTMSKTMNELLAKIADLTEEMNLVKALNEEMEISTVEVFEENKELKSQINKYRVGMNKDTTPKEIRDSQLQENEDIGNLREERSEVRGSADNDAKESHEAESMPTAKQLNSKQRSSNQNTGFGHPLPVIPTVDEAAQCECGQAQQCEITDLVGSLLAWYAIKRMTLDLVRDNIHAIIGMKRLKRPSIPIVFKCFLKAALETTTEKWGPFYGNILAYCLFKKAWEKDVKGREAILQGVSDCCKEIVMCQQWIEWPDIWDTIAEVLVNAHLAADNLFDGARPTLSDFKYAFFAAATDPRRPYILFVQVLKRTVEMLYQNDKATFKGAASKLLPKCKCIIEHMDAEKLSNALSGTTTDFGDNLLEILGRKVLN